MFRAKRKSLVTPTTAATNLVLHLNKNWNPNKENPIDKELETHVGTYDSGYINGTDDILFDKNNYETYPFAIKFGYDNDTTSHTDVFFRSDGKYEIYYYGIKSKPRVCAYIDTSTSPYSIKFTDTNSSSEYGEVDCTFYQEAKWEYDGVENDNWYDQGRQSILPSYTTETVGDIHIYINTSLMPVFYNKEDADEYMATGDYSKALNVKNGEESGSDITFGIGNFATGVVSKINFLGFVIFTEPSMGYTNHGNSIDFRWSGSSSIGCNCFSSAKYDFSNIDKITLKANVTSHYGTDNFPFYLAVGDFDDVNNYKLTDPRYIPYAKVVTTTALGDIILELDVSDITGERYIFFSSVGATCTVTDLILDGKGSSSKRDSIYVIDELIPRMTSDTTPKGICTASTVADGRFAYYGFTMSKGECSINNAQHFWYNNVGADQWIDYEFDSPVTLYNVSFRAYENGNGERFKFQFSLDGTNWTDGDTIALETTFYETYTLSNPVYCKHLRIYCIDNITVINSITAHGHYGKAKGVMIQEGTFTSASTTHGTVEVPLDFDADYILVTLPFSETNLTYAIYDKNRMVMPNKKTYWLIPSENKNYEINMVETNPYGETGITWKTENSFTFHSNGGNTQNKECTFVAYKF